MGTQSALKFSVIVSVTF